MTVAVKLLSTSARVGAGGNRCSLATVIWECKTNGMRRGPHCGSIICSFLIVWWLASGDYDSARGAGSGAV